MSSETWLQDAYGFLDLWMGLEEYGTTRREHFKCPTSNPYMKEFLPSFLKNIYPLKMGTEFPYSLSQV